MGIPAFVRACAAQDGTEIPQSDYDSFDPAELNAAIAQLAAAAQPQETQEAPAAPAAPQEPVRTETRDIFEIFLDSVCLDDDLLTYLIDILKRHAEPEFTKLSHAAARTELKLDDFLAWLGNMELLAGEEEQACAAIMDKALHRLEQEGEMELAAALLSGDETTFKLFRTQAPELIHLPDATYEWYCKNYLDRYYPVRFILHHQGIDRIAPGFQVLAESPDGLAEAICRENILGVQWHPEEMNGPEQERIFAYFRSIMPSR